VTPIDTAGVLAGQLEPQHAVGSQHGPPVVGTGQHMITRGMAPVATGVGQHGTTSWGHSTTGLAAVALAGPALATISAATAATSTSRHTSFTSHIYPIGGLAPPCYRIRSRLMSTAGANDGYFPRGRSILRRVHEHRAVGLMYGQRALGIGAVAPLNFVGTRLHTRALGTPFQRLAHTANWFEQIFFGTREQADAVLRSVERMHQQVRGTLPVDAGPFPAGSAYSAFDPELMLWTVAVIADSGRYFYELLVRPLSDSEKEALWQDYVRFGELFGMPREAVPRTHREFQEWWRAELASDRVHLTPEALQVGHAVMFEIPVPRSRRPGMPLHNLLLLGSLPPRVRDLYGLRYTRAHELAFRGAASAVRESLKLTPRTLRRGDNASFFDTVARTEQAMIARGEPVPGVIA
jgi:uncharacterized protein (DUF2236 family)